MQPIGGMDQIPKAFAQRVGQLIRYETVVDEIRKTASGAKVVCHNQNGQKSVIESDFIICTMPLSVLRNVPNDFSPEYKKVIAEVRYDTPAKIAFYASRRFWELDNDIYGGMSWTSREITQILNPSHGIGQRDGVLVGAYSFGVFPDDNPAKLSVSNRLKAALISGEHLHPGYQQMVSDGISVAWSNVHYSQGGWASWTPEQKKTTYRTLHEPDGAIYFAGEHLSKKLTQLFTLLALAMLAGAASAQTTVQRFGSEQSIIANAIWVGDTLYLSGQLPAVYTGDTKTQTMSTLNVIRLLPWSCPAH